MDSCPEKYPCRTICEFHRGQRVGLARKVRMMAQRSWRLYDVNTKQHRFGYTLGVGYRLRDGLAGRLGLGFGLRFWRLKLGTKARHGGDRLWLGQRLRLLGLLRLRPSRRDHDGLLALGRPQQRRKRHLVQRLLFELVADERRRRVERVPPHVAVAGQAEELAIKGPDQAAPRREQPLCHQPAFRTQSSQQRKGRGGSRKML